MTRTKILFFFTLIAAVVSCEESPYRYKQKNTGLPQTVTAAGVGGKPALINTATICNMKVVWNYTDQTVAFSNLNAQRGVAVRHHIASKEPAEIRDMAAFSLAPSENKTIQTQFALGNMAFVWVDPGAASLDKCRNSFGLGQ